MQAREQIVSEKLGVGRNACGYWRQQDDGMHILAVAIYVGYKRVEVDAPQSYSHWFIGAVQSGQLRGGALKGTVQSLFSAAGCHDP